MPPSFIVSHTVNEFINWAMTIVSIMIIYYVVKFFLVAPPKAEDKDAEQEKRREKFKGWIEDQDKKKKDKVKKKKDAEEKENKKNLVSPSKDNIKNALDKVEEVMIHIGNKARSKAEDSAKDADDLVDQAAKHLQVLRRKYKGAERKHVNEVIHILHAINAALKGQIKRLPDPTHRDWSGVSRSVYDHVKNMRGSLGAAWDKLDEFHE